MISLPRGSTHRFMVYFFEDDAKTIPMVPVDSAAYPVFEIRDLNNAVMQSGVATLSAPGVYYVDWNVPVDAALSYANANWRIDYLMETGTRSVTYSQEFGIADATLASDVGDLSHAILGLPGKKVRLLIRSSVPFEQISLEIVKATKTDDVVISLDSANAGEYVELNSGDAPQAGKINRMLMGTYYAYFYDTDTTKVVGAPNADVQYQVLWGTTQDILAPTDYVVQQLVVIDRQWLNHTAAFQLLIDKIMKKAGIPQHYTLPMQWQHLKNGIGMLNAVHPNNILYTAGTIDSRLTWYWYICSAIDALNSQQLMEIDLHFEHSGQTSTLTYEHVGNLESVMSRFQSYVEKLPEVKYGLFQRSRSIGAYAGRALKTGSGFRNRVYVVDSGAGGQSNLASLILDLGLL